MKEGGEEEGEPEREKERAVKVRRDVCVYYCRTYYKSVRVGGGG